jgi:hypothetical protein
MRCGSVGSDSGSEEEDDKVEEEDDEVVCSGSESDPEIGSESDGVESNVSDSEQGSDDDQEPAVPDRPMSEEDDVDVEALNTLNLDRLAMDGNECGYSERRIGNIGFTFGGERIHVPVSGYPGLICDGEVAPQKGEESDMFKFLESHFKKIGTWADGYRLFASVLSKAAGEYSRAGMDKIPPFKDSPPTVKGAYHALKRYPSNTPRPKLNKKEKAFVEMSDVVRSGATAYVPGPTETRKRATPDTGRAVENMSRRADEIGNLSFKLKGIEYHVPLADFFSLFDRGLHRTPDHPFHRAVEERYGPLNKFGDSLTALSEVFSTLATLADAMNTHEF